MAADMAAALAEVGGAAVGIVLDGVTRLAFVEDLAFQDCPYDGVVLERKRITLLSGVIAAPIPLQEMVLGSTRYTVESSISPYPALEIILTRFGS